MVAFSALTTDDFRTGVQGLLPRGRAWTRRVGSTLASLCAAVGDCLFVFHALCVLFLDVESDPAQAEQLLPDWETDYGLPDSCTPAGATVPQRRAALLAKIAASPGGQSAAYFTSVAAALGVPITITTWDTFQLTGGKPFGSPLVSRAWRFAWRVNAPSISISRFTFGQSRFSEPFWSINGTECECRLRKIAPAHGVLWFNYG
jgi:uncharacterized protein YmfQ (DUF2313 family)